MKWLFVCGVLTLTRLLAKDADYEEAMRYVNLEKAPIISKKEAPSCPYERCTEDLKDRKNIYHDKKNRKYYIMEVNFKKAIPLFLKSLGESNAHLSANFLLDYMANRADYDSNRMDSGFLEKLEMESGIKSGEFSSIFVNAAKIALEKKSCQGLYYSAKIYKHGLFGTRQDASKAKIYFKEASGVCKDLRLKVKSLRGV